MSGAGRRDHAALLFFLCLFALLSSGRLGSLDAGEQLRASTALVATGRLGLPDDQAPAGWVPAPDGRRYEPHDIGNVLLMIPAATFGMFLSQAPAATLVGNPPASARVLASLSCAMVAGLGCGWMFQLLASFTGRWRALRLALAFIFSTIFLAYARTAWDVLGACSGMCGVLLYSVRLSRGDRPARSLLMVAATLAFACSFRYSLAPFVVPAAVFCAWRARRVLSTRALLLGLAVFTALMVPSLVYNAVRTGSALRPATAAPMYLAGANSLDGSILRGLYGLLLSPNRGLFVFSPMLLAAVGLPFVWRDLARPDRDVVTAYLVAASGYTLLIASLVSWGIFGWGPRYLLPVLPIVFCCAALVMLRARTRLQIASTVCLSLMSFALMLPTAVVNWSAAVGLSPDAVNPDAPRPYQIGVAWRAMTDGLQGKWLIDPASGSPVTFPDLLLVRIAQMSGGGAVAAAVLAVLLTGAAAMSLRSVARNG